MHNTRGNSLSISTCIERLVSGCKEIKDNHSIIHGVGVE